MPKLSLKYAFCFLLGFASCVNSESFAQAKIDSMVQQLSTASEDTNKVILLNTLSFAYHKVDPEQGINYARQSIDLADKLQFDRGLAHAYNSLGASYWNQTNLDSALKYYRKSHDLNNTIQNIRGAVGALSNMAIIYESKGLYLEAISMYKQAMEVMKANGFESYLAITSTNLGIVFQKIGNYPEALKHHLEAIRLGEKLDMPQLLSPAWSNIGTVYNLIGEPHKELEAKQKALAIAEELDDQANIAITASKLGFTYAHRQEYDKALVHYERALKITQELGKKRSIVSLYNNLGEVYRNLKDYKKSLDMLQKSLDLALEIGHHKALVSTYLQLGLTQKAIFGEKEALKTFKTGFELATEQDLKKDLAKEIHECYARLGDYEKAYYYQHKYMMARDSLINEENIKELASIEARYEFEGQLSEKNSEILLLEAREKVSSLRVIVLSILIIFAVVVSFVIYRFLLIKKERKRRQLEEISQFKERMTSMVAHDLKNPLSIILNNGSENSDTKRLARQMLNLVLNMLDVHKFENAAIMLNPSTHSLHHIIAQATEQVRPLLSSKNLSFDVDLIKPDGVRVDEEYMVRVFINLLTNAIKFSPNNSRIEIAGEPQEYTYLITVKDYGPGIASSEMESIFQPFTQLDPRKSANVSSTGLGLSFCQWVIQAQGGKISVDSEEGKWTCFSFTVPLAAESVSQTLEKSSEVSVNDHSRKKVTSVLPQLKALELYQAVEIEKMLSELLEDPDPTVVKWAEAVIAASYQHNQEHFDTLISEVEN